MCRKCKKARNQEHWWDGCTCRRCEAQRDEEHDWSGDLCTRCGANKRLRKVTSEEIKVIPVKARVAFVARCSRLVQPLFGRMKDTHAKDVALAIRVAEAAAVGGFNIPNLSNISAKAHAVFKLYYYENRDMANAAHVAYSAALAALHGEFALSRKAPNVSGYLEPEGDPFEMDPDSDEFIRYFTASYIDTASKLSREENADSVTELVGNALHSYRAATYRSIMFREVIDKYLNTLSRVESASFAGSSYDSLPEALIRSDFETVKALSLEMNWTDETPVPPGIFRFLSLTGI